MIKISILSLLILPSFPGFSQAINQGAGIEAIVEKEVNRFMAEPTRVGVSVGVYQGGKTYTCSRGRLEIHREQQPTAHTLYEIGSITKTFTATLLAQAVADGKVKLKDDIRTYLGDGYPNLSYQGHPVRLAHLINHTSRLPFLLPNTLNLSTLSPDSIPGVITAQQNHYSKAAFLNDLRQVELDTIPGTKFRYSNASTQLLGFILEQVYGKKYEELLQAYILLPARMTHTVVGTQQGMASLAKGYNEAGNLMPYNPPMLLAAGGIYSSVEDMLQYVKFQLNDQSKVVALTHQPTFGQIQDFAIGLNWQMKLVSDRTRKIWQSGGTFGFSSYLAFYPELDLGIVLLSNQADRTAQGALENTAEAILKEMASRK